MDDSKEIHSWHPQRIDSEKNPEQKSEPDSKKLKSAASIDTIKRELEKELQYIRILCRKARNIEHHREISDRFKWIDEGVASLQKLVQTIPESHQFPTVAADGKKTPAPSSRLPQPESPEQDIPNIPEFQDLLPPVKQFADTSPTESDVTLSILLADSHAHNIDLMVQMLDEVGHEVIVARNTTEILFALDIKQFDAMIINAADAGMKTAETISMIRNLERAGSRRLPIIAISPTGEESERQRYQFAGVNSFLVQPVSRFDLLRELEELTAVRRKG